MAGKPIISVISRPQVRPNPLLFAVFGNNGNQCNAIIHAFLIAYNNRR